MTKLTELSGGNLELAACWFDRLLSDSSLTDIERRDFAVAAQRIGTGALREVVALGADAGAQYRAERAVYNAIQQRRQRSNRTYPEILASRAPSTRLTVIGGHYPLKVDHDLYRNWAVDPLVAVLEGDPHAGYIYGGRGENNPNRAAELQEKGINFLVLDERHFEVVEKRGWNDKLRYDDYSADTFVGLFGLNQEEHGQDEIVLLYDPWGRQNLDGMAEAVKARVGKYPHIGTETPPPDMYEGHAKWDVYEYVPPAPMPQRPTLESVLVNLAAVS